MSTPPRVLLLGDGELAVAVEHAVRRAGGEVAHLLAPGDREVHDAVTASLSVVMVVVRDDIAALRLALLVEHARPGVPLIVTLFDRTVADQLRTVVPHCRVMSLPDLVAPALAGPCLDAGLTSLVASAPAPVGVADGAEGAPVLVPLAPTRRRAGRRAAGWLRSAARPYDTSARVLLVGLLGFLAILAADALIGVAWLGESPAQAFYAATKALVTVGPNPAVDRGGAGLRVVAALLMLTAIGFAAVLTAGIVNRLLDPRLTAIAGRRAVPRDDHVVVVGLGQVGLRLAQLLRSLDVPVVAVERRRDAPGVRIARRLRIPVVIAEGGDRALLQRLGLQRARALAAVTSDDVENIAIAVAALAVHGPLRVVLRAGDGDVSTETRALFRIGVVCDLHRLGADLLAAAALGHHAVGVASQEGRTWLVVEDGPARRLVAVPGTAPAAERSGG